MCKIAICDDDKEYREKIKTVIETEGILSSNEIRFYEYESGKELMKQRYWCSAPAVLNRLLTALMLDNRSGTS